MYKKLIGLGIALAMLFSLTACVADIDGRHKGFSSGFNYSGFRYSLIMHAVRSDKTEFNIDDVVLDFYCGFFGELPYAYRNDTIRRTVSVVFYLTTSWVGQWIDPQDDYLNVDNQYFIAEVSAEDFWSESFLASQTMRHGKVFNHIGKSIKIPKEAFSEQWGSLQLYAQVVDYSYEDKLYHFDSSKAGPWTLY